MDALTGASRTRGYASGNGRKMLFLASALDRCPDPLALDALAENPTSR